MDNRGVDVLQTSTLLEDVNKITNSVGVADICYQKKSKKLHLDKAILEFDIAEAEKRLKMLEQVYLRTYKEHEKMRAQRQSSYCEEVRTRTCCNYVGYHIDRCKYIIEQLQKALDKLTSTGATQKGREITDPRLQILMLHGCKTLAQEKKLLQQKAEHQQPDNDDLSRETVDFKYINSELNYIKKTFLRRSRKSSIHELLKEAKETKKLREKAIVNGALVGNLTTHENLTKYLENEIKLMEKLVRELQKDKTETEDMLRDSRRTYHYFAERTKRLERKKEHICGQWDNEKKYMLGLKNKLDGF